MSEDTIEGLAVGIRELEKKRSEDLAWLNGLGYPDLYANIIFNQPPQQKRLDIIRQNDREIDRLRSKLISLSLSSIESSSKSLVQGTSNLLRSSEDQAQAARSLEASSRRLELLGGGTLIISSVLIVFAAASYFFDAFIREGLTVRDAVQLTGYALLIVVAMVGVAFFLVARKTRQRGPENIPPVDGEKQGRYGPNRRQAQIQGIDGDHPPSPSPKLDPATLVQLRFQELLSELTTRESSVLVIATVTSSASLVLLGTNFASDGRIQFAAVLFPIVGFFYRELTIFTIDRTNYLEMKKILGASSYSAKESFWQAGRLLRRMTLRTIFPFPSALWLNVFSISYPLQLPFVPYYYSIPVIVVVALGLCVLEWNYKDERAKTNSGAEERLVGQSS